MNCPDQLSLLRFVDGEASAEEASVLDTHLSGCTACRRQVRELTAERLALTSALQTVDESAPVPTFLPRPTLTGVLAWIGWALLGAWTVSFAWSSLLSAFALPDWLEWLAPGAERVGLQTLIGLLVGLSSGALAPVVDLGQTLLPFILAGIATFGVCWIINRYQGDGRRLSLSLIATVLVLTVSVPADAFELKRDEERVVISTAERIDDTLIVTSETIIVDGDVTGDLVAFGEDVTVRGRVGGNLIVAGETVSVSGEVGGNLLAAGERIDVRGANLSGNLYGAASEIKIDATTALSGNAAFGARDVELGASVGRDLWTGARRLSVFGPVSGDVRFAGESLRLSTGASVGGDLTAIVAAQEKFNRADGVVIGGRVSVEVHEPPPSRYTTFEYYAGQLGKLFAALVTGIVLFYLFPGLAGLRLTSGRETLVAAGLGVVALVATPILCVLLLATLVGVPVALLTFMLYLALLYLAGIVTANQLGRLLLGAEDARLWLSLLIGLAILFVLFSIPVIGGITKFFVVIIGLGLLLLWLWEAHQTRDS